MFAMMLGAPHQTLEPTRRPDPIPGPGEVRLRVHACGVCRTDLHVVDGELGPGPLPIVPGHEIVGVVEAVGDGVPEGRIGQRLGVPWLGWTCGECRYCRSSRENLCDFARFTGRDIDGGFAELAVVDRRTPGMVGADLANVANEAALASVRRGGNVVTMPDFEEAIDRIQLGLKRRVAS